MTTEAPNCLRSEPFKANVVFLTGGSGYIGALIAAWLLVNDDCSLILPVREGADPNAFRGRLQTEVDALGGDMAAVERRLNLYPWRGTADIGNNDWAATLDSAGIDEIIHCAGCLDYYDRAALTAVNIDLTDWLLVLGKRWKVKRFTYMSTAYSAGYRDAEILESLAEEPLKDPTDYTWSKRTAEHRVAASGLPWLILRPSILIGECASGRYSGKRYGLYQQWMGLERLMLDRYHPAIHTVATDQPLNLLHQDVFQRAFDSAHRWLPDSAICNMVSDNSVAPTLREVWDLWMQIVRPQEIYYYPRFEDVDLREINMRQRAYLTFAQVNLEIGAHSWCFEDRWLKLLEAKGLDFRHATIDSVYRCLQRFISASEPMARYQERFSNNFPDKIVSHEVCSYEPSC